VDPRLLTPVLLGAVLLWAVYRRVRRNFGRQAVSRARLQWRVALLAVVGGLILLGSARSPALLAALAGGMAAGAALGFVGLRHTVFETTPEGRFYTPHTYLGLAVTALFLGRLVYRLSALYLGSQAALQQDQDPFAAYQRSPLTLAVFGVLVGYYLVFNVGVLRKSAAAAAVPESRVS
jgi:hypothetical protein